MRRFVVLVVALAACLSLGAVAVLPAFADDAPPPIPFPPGISGPTPTVHATPKPGPTYVITPGTKGSQLPAPVTVLPSGTKPLASGSPHPTPSTRSPAASPTAGSTPTLGVTEVAAPVAGATAASSPNDTDRWWMIGAAGFLLLVLSEFARLDLRGRKHPLPVR
ncbi:MAG: hypothetical protein JWR52_3129 [Marmoricola sp.]|nr:hypothetical protein [Marmoricola sp.]